MLFCDQSITHLSIQHRRFDFPLPHDASEREHIAAVKHVLRAESVA